MANTMYLLDCGSGFTVEVSTYGASIRRLMVPDRHGEAHNVALSPMSMENHAGGSYAGAVIGPSAGRIKGGNLPLDDSIYQLSRNDGENNLHGGSHGLSSQIWDVVDQHVMKNAVSLTLRCCLPDGLDGFPGNREFLVRYIVTAENSLRIEFTAVTDKPTWVDLTSHLYVNLCGDFSRSALDHQLHVDAEQVCFNNEEHLPIGLHSVNNTPFDFRKPAIIEEQVTSDPEHIQLVQAKGYNHAFRLNKENNDGPERAAAVLYDQASGRRMRLYTDAPAIVLYSGGYLDSSLQLSESSPAMPSCALALEAQQLPDAVNHFDWPKQILYPGQVWSRYIQFGFDTTGGNHVLHS